MRELDPQSMKSMFLRPQWAVLVVVGVLSLPGPAAAVPGEWLRPGRHYSYLDPRDDIRGHALAVGAVVPGHVAIMEAHGRAGGLLRLPGGQYVGPEHPAGAEALFRELAEHFGSSTSLLFCGACDAGLGRRSLVRIAGDRTGLPTLGALGLRRADTFQVSVPDRLVEGLMSTPPGLERLTALELDAGLIELDPMRAAAAVGWASRYTDRARSYVLYDPATRRRTLLTRPQALAMLGIRVDQLPLGVPGYASRRAARSRASFPVGPARVDTSAPTSGHRYLRTGRSPGRRP